MNSNKTQNKKDEYNYSKQECNHASPRNLSLNFLNSTLKQVLYSEYHSFHRESFT